MNKLMRISKISKSDLGLRWVGAASDDRIDHRNNRASIQLYQSFIEKAKVRGMPFLNVCHYMAGNVGMADKMWVDGSYLKIAGTFFDNDSDMVNETIKALLIDRQKPQPEIQQSIGFFCNKVDYEDDVMVFTEGWLEHTALTHVPVNPRTDISIIMQGQPVTRFDDAATIVGSDIAHMLDEFESARTVNIEQKSLVMPKGFREDVLAHDWLGTATETVVKLLCSQICAPMPVLLFADKSPLRNSTSASEVFLIDPDMQAYIMSLMKRETISLDDPGLLALSQALVKRHIGIPFSDRDVVELMSQKPSYDYLQKLVGILKESVPEDDFNMAQKTARGYSGGRAYPAESTDIDVEDYPAMPETMPSELVDETNVSKMVRALVTIFDANIKADIPDYQKHTNVLRAVEDVKKTLLYQINACKGKKVKKMAETLTLLSNAELVEMKTLISEIMEAE